MNNIHNVLISKIQVEKIINSHLKKPVSIKNLNLYRQAFMHKSFTIKDNFEDPEDQNCMFEDFKVENNEKLEFFGDSCINLITAEYLFDRFPDKDEGFLTKLRTKLVRNTQLSFLGEQLGFNKYLLISTHIEKISGRNNPRLIEDVFESFAAVLFKDLGFYSCREFIYSCFNKYINMEYLTSNNDNYKDILLRFFQVNDWNHPIYETISHVCTSSKREFSTCIVIDKSIITNSIFYQSMVKNHNKIIVKYNIPDNEKCYIEIGFGATKKTSEQDVSKNALSMMKVPNNF
jgi:ribonuclease-3